MESTFPPHNLPARPSPVAILLALTIALVGGGLGTAAAADDETEYRFIDDRWIIALGGYLADFTTDASIGTGNLIGTTLRLEDDLGLSEDDRQFRVDGIYRFNRRHAIGYGFWSLTRNGSEVLDRQIEVGDEIYGLNATLVSKFDAKWFRADWRYSFLRNPKGEAGINLGLSTYDFDVALEGEACAGPPDDPCSIIGDNARVEESLLAPVPTLGVFINYAIKPKLLFRANLNFFDLSVGDYEGRIVDTTLLFEWYFTRHFGVGGGTNGTDIRVKDSSEDPFSVDYDISGLMAYLTFNWGGNLKD
jgi:hypothetical protein